jgi:hypothetical protein
VMVRSSAGEDIAAACGQLAVDEPRRRHEGAITHDRTSYPSETTTHDTPPLWASGRGEGNASEVTL